MLIEASKSQLLVIDVQERLVPAMSDAERLVENCGRLMQGARLLDVPVTVSEQYPKGLGPTIGPIADLAKPGEVLAKTHFSCSGDSGLAERMSENQRPQLVLAGIESHVCVLQSALGFLRAGYDVTVVADAVTSRLPDSVALATARLGQAGVTVANVEMVLFEWTEKADSPTFRSIRDLIK